MGDSFAKNLKKQSARAKEKLLESLGKADKTTDEQFQEHAQNFQKQQKSAERLQKEIRNYVACVRAMGQASKGFHEALREVYEPDWPGDGNVKAMSHSIELLWDDYCEKVTDQALNPLNSYSSQFPDIKTKIAKRSRKLVDYDGARHNFDTLKTTGKKPDEAKLQKAQEQLTVAKRIFDDINNELMDSLPALYDSRITFYVNNFQTIFNLEQTFHAETAKLTRELCTQMDELGHSLGRLRVPRQSSMDGEKRDSHSPPFKPLPSTSNNLAKEEPRIIAQNDNKHQPKEPPQPSTPPSIPPLKEIPSHNRNGEAEDVVKEGGSPGETEKPLPASPNPFDGGSSAGSRSGSRDSAPPVVVEEESLMEKEEEKEGEEEEEEGPKEAEIKPQTPGISDGPPPPIQAAPLPEPKAAEARNVLYKVRATHRYTAEDSDELSFEAGEIIAVTPYDDPEEQDEGWLMGTIETSGKKGVFPANFTKPL